MRQCKDRSAARSQSTTSKPRVVAAAILERRRQVAAAIRTAVTDRDHPIFWAFTDDAGVVPGNGDSGKRYLFAAHAGRYIAFAEVESEELRPAIEAALERRYRQAVRAARGAGRAA
jgi:hypothetical protein